MTPQELCTAAAAVLTERDLCKGYLALNAKGKEVYPWDLSLAADITAVTLLGALCLAVGDTPANADVQQAYMHVYRVLRDEHDCPYTPETWNDQPERTKQEVLDILRQAADV